MALALASSWRRAALAGAGLFALGACGTDILSDATPAEAPVVDRPERVAGEMARGQQALSAGDLSTAQAAFTAALRGSPNDPAPAMGLAETYLAMGDYKTAGKVFDLIEKSTSGPDEGRLLQGRGLVALGQGETDEAIRLLERSVDRSPGLWRAWAGLGRAYGRQGKSRQARAAFARAEDAAPVRALVINDVGMLHLEENDPAAALEAFQRALAIDPGNATASANARIARAMLGDYDAAASGARPGELPDVLNNVGYIAIVNGDFEVADRFLRRAVEISPVYHEAASANLDLLAQAMKGVPVLATAGRGVASAEAATGTELSSVSGELAAGQGRSAPEPAIAVAALAPGGAAPPAPEPGGMLDRPATTPAASANAGQESTVTMAHGFRWESPPVSAKKKKRKRRATPPPAAGAPDGDPRTAAWPVIAPWPEPGPGPAPQSAAASAPDVADPGADFGAEPAAESRAPVEAPDAPDAVPENPDAWRAETPAEAPEMQAAQASSVTTETAPRATAPAGTGQPE